jgi:predicted lipase
MSISETKSDLFNSNYEPRFVLSVDHSHSTVILAFRGTMSARDVVVDLAGEVISLAIGDDDTLYALHGGMLKVVARVSEPSHSSGLFQKTKSLLDDFPEYSLTLTGHSLGAGLAAILSLLWADPDTGRTRPESGLRDAELKVYSFACPSVFDIRLSQRTENLILTSIIAWDW